MTRVFQVVLVALMLTGFSPNSDQYSVINNRSFTTGERLDFRVHVGFINAGEGTMLISDDIHKVNRRPCYKIDVLGQTVGLFDFFIRVRDNWGTYLDTASIVPHKFYQIIEEGRFRKHEIIEFDHQNDSAIVKRPDKEDRPDEYFQTPPQPQDLISGYYYIRTLDYSKLYEGQLIALKAFYDKKVYDFKVRFIGRETIKTKLGKVNTLVLSPIMPKNDLFEEEDESIKVWLSDDDNKIPVKIKAKMWVGSVEIDLTNAQNLRSPLAIVSK